MTRPYIAKRGEITWKGSVTIKSTLIVGIFLIGAGLVMPTAVVVQWLRPGQILAPPMQQQLTVGVISLRICLALLGGSLIVLGRLPLWQTDSQAVTPVVWPRHRAESVLLVALLGAALGLRLYDLGDGLWHDEITTYLTYVKPLSLAEIASTYQSENQHFLFNLSARVALLLLGDSVFALRLPAVLFGVASIGALYLLGRAVTNRHETLLACALMTFSYHHIWFSQNARGYTALLFWTLLSSWLLIYSLQRTDGKYWLAYAIVTALGVYTHTTMLFVTSGQCLIYLWALVQRRQTPWPRRWLGWWLGFCFAGFLTILLYALALPQFLAGIGEPSTIPAWKNPLWTMLEILRGLQLGFFGFIFVIPALLAFGIGVASYLRTNPILIQLFIWPILLCVALIVGLGHHLWPRFFFFAMGFGVLIAVRGVQVIGESLAGFIKLSPPKRVWAGSTMAVGMVLVSALSIPFVYGPKQDYGAALTYVQANRVAGDAVVVVGLATYTYQHLYQTDWVAIESLPQLNQTRSQAKRTWLVYSFLPEAEAVYPEVMANIQHDFVLVKQFPGTLNNGTVFVLRADASTAGNAEQLVDSDQTTQSLFIQ